MHIGRPLVAAGPCLEGNDGGTQTGVLVMPSFLSSWPRLQRECVEQLLVASRTSRDPLGLASCKAARIRRGRRIRRIRSSGGVVRRR